MNDNRFRVAKLQNAEDWVRWKFTLRNLLDAEDVYEVVTGSWLKPEDPGADADASEQRRYRADLKTWTQADKKARKLIVTTVDDKPMQYLMTCDTALEMWNKLLAVYKQKSEASLLMMLCQFYSFKKKLVDDMARHISKLERMRECLRQMGEKVSDVNVMARILSILPDTYMHFASAWDSAADEKRTIEQLTSRLMMEEARLRIRDAESTDSVALLANKANKSVNKVEIKNPSQNTNKKPEQQKQKWKNVKCFKCHKMGHIKRNCKLKGETSGQSSSQPEGDAFVGELTNGFERQNSWYADSGASHHMSNQREWFSNFTAFEDPKKIFIGNGVMCAKGHGEIIIEAFANGKWTRKRLESVLYVPEGERNLFSLGSALDHGLTQKANNERMEFFKNGTKVAVGVRDGRLYKMLFKVVETAEKAFVASTRESLQLWHERLSHQHTRHVKTVLKRQGIDVKGEIPICEACMFGKQQRKPFPPGLHKATVTDLIHADVCGPMEEVSIGGSRFFVFFKDEFSHFWMIYFLKNKSEV